MRHGNAMTLCATVVCAGTLVTCAPAQSDQEPRSVTFELTSLTSRDLHLQHGCPNYVTLSMKEVGSRKVVEIDDPPAFPLIATLRYLDRDGAERTAVSACDYRC